MKLTIVGCAGGMPRPGSPSSGYLVETRTASVLLDCGPGVSGALPAYSDLGRLDAVVISHMHLDHCHDLLPLGKSLVPLLDRNSGRRVALFVPPGAAATLRRHAALYPIGLGGSHDGRLDRVFDDVFDVVECRPGTSISVADTQIDLVTMQHRAPSCGVRVTEGAAVLSYTGDTGMDDALIGLARDAALLLCDATLAEPETDGHGHLCAAQAGTVAKTAEVERLVLTHIVRDDDEWRSQLKVDAASIFDGAIDIAQPGNVFDL